MVWFIIVLGSYLRIFVCSSVVHGILHVQVGEVSGVSGVSIRASEIDIEITADKINFYGGFRHYYGPCE